MTVGIVGSGAIATGMARAAAARMPVRVWVRSEAAAERVAARVPDGDVLISTDPLVLRDAAVVVEAIVEDVACKSDLLRALDEHLPAAAVVASTTSSLSVAELASLSGRPDRFAGLHVFNPVHRMPLVELVTHDGCSEATLTALADLCERLGKRSIVVPDTPGFVVNALLFPYLFSAVELLERTGLAPADVDDCMKLGAGHPMGPLELLDFVGLDVAYAIAHNLGVTVPGTLADLVGAGRLGRKAGSGFYAYEQRLAA